MKNLRNRRSTLGFKGGAMALALTALTVTACQTPDDTAGTTAPQATTEQTTSDQQASQPDDTDIQVGDLAGNLEDYLGQTVSVRAEVVEVLSDDAFVIRGDGLFGGNDVVVFNTSGTPLMLPGEDITERVQVTGQVQEVIVGQPNPQGLTLDEETFGDYEGDPAIMAESMVLAPEPGEVSDNPEAFYNQVIAVDGAIGEQYDDNTFTITGANFFGGSDVLVVGEAASIATIQDDGDVVILGTLRPFNAAELEREYSLTWDENLRQTIQSDFSEDPILVAQQVYPVNR